MNNLRNKNLHFGTEIKKIRNEKKFSVRQLALQAGLSPSFISQVENYKADIPKENTLRKLAKGLRIPDKQIFKLAGIEQSNDDIISISNLPEKDKDHNKDSVDLDDLSTVMTFQGEPIPEKYKEIVRDLLRNLKDKEENEK